MDTVALVIVVLGLVAAWRVSLWLWPVRPCRRCGGNRKTAGSDERRWGWCSACNRTGEQRRFGAGKES